jgi:hypothetical protein
MGPKDGLLGIVHHLRNRFWRSLYELCPERVFTIEDSELLWYSKDVRLSGWHAVFMGHTWFRSEA